MLMSKAHATINGVHLHLRERDYYDKQYHVVAIKDDVIVEIATNPEKVPWATNKAYKMARGGHVTYHGELDVFSDVLEGSG